MDGVTIKDLLEVGASGILTVVLIALWRDNQKCRDTIIKYLEAAKQERHAVYSQLTARRLEDDLKRENKPPTSP